MSDGEPSAEVAIAATLVFAIVCSALIYRTIRLRASFFYMIVLASLTEAGGMAFRAHSALHPTSVNAFLISYCAIILSPSFAAAGCYMSFGRLVQFATPVLLLKTRLLWIPPRLITIVFVCLDVLSFLIQLLGLLVIASVYSPKANASMEDTVSRGECLLKLGLVIQLLCFGFFAGVGARFLWVSRAWDTPNGTEWRLLGWVISSSAALLTLRAVFRVAEFSSTLVYRYIATHEWLFWVCDAVLVLVVFISFTYAHPGDFLPSYLLHIRTRKGPELSKSSPTILLSAC